jgi:hypothetical protein
MSHLFRSVELLLDVVLIDLDCRMIRALNLWWFICVEHTGQARVDQLKP